MPTTITVSAQFGGRDAAAAVLPHFRALKVAAEGRCLAGFPLREIAFILRVDGEVNTYGLSGAGCLEFDRGGDYVSVDIGITQGDRSQVGDSSLPVFISMAIMQSLTLLQESRDVRLAGTEFGAVESDLRAFCAAYEVRMRSNSSYSSGEPSA